ncbi:OLC1v1007805C1 [Oldenlandia corymbosa var. corymbosa]|uniref:OLC1v1007805C1 n=1 Tax=Oldenlandia corymbosa var. corymbosa TaxID=529605 RepID=A0AAV1DK60_OLDCO|nr:OLC1v1007805C1 [Oldenlandia corymbosa var. corymbosa]
MEGLIPMVFKTIKRSRTRRHYEYLSPSAAEEHATEAQGYNIADFYTNGEYVIRDGQDGYAEVGKVKGQHRRHKSFQQDDHHTRRAAFGFSPNVYHHNAIALSPHHQRPAKKLVRFRSHRLFSCVTGA